MVEGRHTDAARYARFAIRDAARVSGPNSEDLGLANLRAAQAARERGDRAGAHALTRRAAEIFSRLPVRHAAVREALALNEAELLLDDGAAAAALALLTDTASLQQQTRLRSASIDPRGRWLVAMGRAHIAAGDAAAGLPLLQKAHAWRGRIYGFAVPMQQALARQIATVQAETGKTSKL